MAPDAPAPAAPLVRAFARESDGSRRPLGRRVPYANRGLEFEFSAPQFAIRENLRLESRVDGIDETWVPAGKDAMRELSAVRSGNYVLRVHAVAGTGLVSPETNFAFTVEPPWWLTWPALLAGAGLLGLVVAGAAQWRVRTLRRRNLELERKVQERTDELAQASAAKTQFVANMSHDIRNPLSGIVGLTIALEDTNLDGKQRELVSTLSDCTTYLSSLVDDVLDFARIESGHIELRPTAYSPSELLNTVVTTLRAQITATGAFVSVESDPGVPPLLWGDAGRIQQILVNFITNALKYAGGEITLSVGKADGMVRFAVTDRGPGIPVSEQENLFTAFSRLKEARQSGVKGTGLGLASCRLVATALGGDVGLTSDPGKGACFYLRVPLVRATEPADSKTPAFVMPPTTVLLVEDADYNALAAAAVLKKLGLECDRAATGLEAVQLFERKRHHLVLLDRNLPDIDGTEVARRLRAIEADGVHAVLLAVTAYCSTEDRQLCLDSGMDAFVGKPLTPEKLRDALRDIAGHSRVAGPVPLTLPPEPRAPHTPPRASGAAPAGAAGRPVAEADPVAPADAGPAPAAKSAAAAGALKLDTTLLHFLAEGREGGVAAQVERYIAELQQTYEAMAATPQTDLGVFANAAHKLLGNARMIGADRVVRLLATIETAARRGDAAEVQRLVGGVRGEVDAIIAELRRT